MPKFLILLLTLLSMFFSMTANAAPAFKDPVIKFVAIAEEDFKVDLKNYLVNPNEPNLVWGSSQLPSWLKIDTLTGQFSGHPTSQEAGVKTFKLSVIQGEVGDVNHPAEIWVIARPKWKNNPVDLGKISTGGIFSFSLANQIDNPSHLPLEFSISGAPTWLTLTNESLTGLPEKKNIGKFQNVSVTLKNTEYHFIDTTYFLGEVFQPNHAPKWSQDPINLGEIYVKDLFNFDLSAFASDEDQDILTFTKLDGPAWLNLTKSGKLTGQPEDANVGNYVAHFEVSDGIDKAQVSAFGLVKSINPQINADKLFFTVKERSTLSVNLNDPNIVKDPKGRPLTFSFVNNNDSWVTLSNGGVLMAQPLHSQIGVKLFSLVIKNDLGGVATAPLTIKVIRDPRPPVWLENPILFSVKANESFSADIKKKAKDFDGVPLTFSIKSGPNWLNLSSEGQLSGQPKETHAGVNTFTLTVMNDVLSADTVLKITVISEVEVEDSIAVDADVANALVEDLWVVDNTPLSKAFMNIITDYIEVYFSELRKHRVKSNGLFISANGITKEVPFISEWGDYLISTEQGNVTSDWAERTADSWSSVNEDINSPIWSLERLYKKLPKITSIYQKSYALSSVYSQVTIFTSQIDRYHEFTLESEKASWSAKEFADHFIQIHQKLKKPYRINSIVQRSQKPGLPVGGIDMAYMQLSERTGGEVFPWQYNADTEKILVTLAQKAIFNSNVFAKKRIKLSHNPLYPKEIELKIGGVIIPGNKGVAGDAWSYDSKTNEVVIEWQFIDATQLKPGDKIQVRYKYLNS